MKIYLSQTDYRDYNNKEYPLENIKKQYDIFCKQKMYFDTENCSVFCNGKCVSKYSNYNDVLEIKKELKNMTINQKIEYCTKWEFKGFILSRQQYYLEGGKIDGY